MILRIQTNINEDFLEAACSVSNYEDLCALFLCLFYCSGINKTQLEICLDLMKITNVITDKKIPKSFSECSKVVHLTKWKTQLIMKSNGIVAHAKISLY